MLEVWIPTKKAAEILEVTNNSILKNIKLGKYRVRRAKLPSGQNGFLIARSSLPDRAISISSPVYIEELQQLKDWQRAEAFRRLDILQKWEDYILETGLGIDKSIPGFIDSIGIKITAQTLYRWKRAYGQKNIMGLVPNWRNARKRFSAVNFTPEAQKFAHSVLFFYPNKKIRDIYRMVQKEGKMNGWSVPSYTTVKRFLKEMPTPKRITFGKEEDGQIRVRIYPDTGKRKKRNNV